jgi:hypothetical protein
MFTQKIHAKFEKTEFLKIPPTQKLYLTLKERMWIAINIILSKISIENTYNCSDKDTLQLAKITQKKRHRRKSREKKC